MNKRQKEVLKKHYENEKAVIDKLILLYGRALDDINERIRILSASDMQSKIYQRQYQENLKMQIVAILEKLYTKEYETVSDFLDDCYYNAFVGFLYDLQGQGIPFLFPINQKMVVDAIQHQTKLTSSLYREMGLDIKELQVKISNEISRGISTGMRYEDIARNISEQTTIPLNRSRTIARTEGNRIRSQAAFNAALKAKAQGADIVKQWDSTLDSRTRPRHRIIDGETRELEEKFSNGLLFPCDPNGPANEVVNCRCAAVTTARWALDEAETKYLGDTKSMTAEQREHVANKLGIPIEDLDKYSRTIVPLNAKSYEDFQQQYNQIWHYEGSNLQKEVEARIASYKK